MINTDNPEVLDIVRVKLRAPQTGSLHPVAWTFSTATSDSVSQRPTCLTPVGT
jgi:hypothetical protein